MADSTSLRKHAPAPLLPTSPARRPALSTTEMLFTATVFVSATLLFFLEPMVAKRLLPLWGGSPSVWVTCTVFFQAMLLLGYLYAHLSRTRLPPRMQLGVHLALVGLAAASIPFRLQRTWEVSTLSSPVLGLLLTLLSVVGLPFFALSASAPLLQHWFAGAEPGKDPYRLYAASNLGSLIALLLYPVLIEPLVGVRMQGLAWSAGFVSLLALAASCARATALAPAFDRSVGRPAAAGPIPRADVLRWIVLAFVPSSLMIGLTSAFTTDIGSIPLFWVVPLALYLLTFVLAFARRPISRFRWVQETMPFVATALLISQMIDIEMSMAVLMALHVGVFLLVALALHSRLADLRPEAGKLTAFYLWVSFGGMLGGIFNSLVAPLVFTIVLEYPLMLVVAVAIAWLGAPPGASRERKHRWISGIALTCVALYAVGRGQLHGEENHVVIARDRNFFGALKIEQATNGIRKLTNGTTIHGAQSTKPELRWAPLTYYATRGPVGDVFYGLGVRLRNQEIGVVGLGVGSIAAWGKPDQKMTFFEIDEKVLRAALGWFTYLADGKAPGRVILGDARLQLEKVPDGTFRLLFLDAFSSDAIPAHLLTTEAMALYLRKITLDGMLAIHITNRHLALEPVLARLAQEHHLVTRWIDDKGAGKEGRFESTWVVVARREEDFGGLAKNARWTPLPSAPEAPLWTDDFTSFFPILRLGDGNHSGGKNGSYDHHD